MLLSLYCLQSWSIRDEHYGFQLYQSDPSGNYGGWKAVAIGAGAQAAQNLLKTEFKEDTTVGAIGRQWGLLHGMWRHQGHERT